ncbi:MAG: PLP-dependent aminotransferase family protein [Vicinamibacterales bacterium]
MIDYSAFLSTAARLGQGSAIRKMGQLAAGRSDLISFAPGYPDPAVFAWDEFREITARLLDGSDGTALQYGPTRGIKPLLEGLTTILAERGISAKMDELLVTTGSQQGLDLVGRVLIDPGDVVLVELPAYTGAIAAFKNAQARLVGVRQEPDGIDIGHLEEVLARERGGGNRVRFLYVVPNFQNPAGLLTSQEKRRQLLEWASRRDMLIVEDDPYGDLYFGDSAGPADTKPIKACDSEGRVVYLSSFSKTLAPGLRVAWMAGPEPVVAKFEQAKQAMDLMSGALDQRIVYEAWKRGVLASRLPMLRGHYRHKRTVMESTIRRELGDLITWPEPRGGFFLWASLPECLDADEMLPRAAEKNVIYVAGSAFLVDGTGHNRLRLSFSLPPAERIEKGVVRLALVIRDELARKGATAGISASAS